MDANTKEVSGGRTPSQTSLKSDDSKSGRKIRSKKLKIAYDDSAAPNADQATIKREQMDGVSVHYYNYRLKIIFISILFTGCGC